MAPDVPLRWLDVRTLVPPDSIGARTAGSQGNQLVFFHEVAHHLMVRGWNGFHFVKPCSSHNGIVWKEIVDHRESYIQGD